MHNKVNVIVKCDTCSGVVAANCRRRLHIYLCSNSPIMQWHVFFTRNWIQHIPDMAEGKPANKSTQRTRASSSANHWLQSLGTNDGIFDMNMPHLMNVRMHVICGLVAEHAATGLSKNSQICIFLTLFCRSTSSRVAFFIYRRWIVFRRRPA